MERAVPLQYEKNLRVPAPGAVANKQKITRGERAHLSLMVKLLRRRAFPAMRERLLLPRARQ
jgi:hypothetical protein